MTCLIPVVALPFIHSLAPKFLGISYLIIGMSAMIFLKAAFESCSEEPISPQEKSREACKVAFEKLSLWTSTTFIDFENIGYYRQLTVELDRVLDRHMKNFPDDKGWKRMKQYRDYVDQSYAYEVPKW